MTGAWDLPDSRSFVEKLLILLDEGAFTATYKFAVLLALMDVCLEDTDVEGRPPAAIPLERLAEKTIELYWPQTGLFAGREGAVVLRQNSGGQAAIVTAVRKYRAERSADGLLALAAARVDAPGWSRLVSEVSWKLAQMPVPRLQVRGSVEDRFIYDYNWTKNVKRAEVANGQQLVLVPRPGVADLLVSLNSLIRPLVHRRWADLVARFNSSAVDDARVQDFLFGSTRNAVARFGDDLRDLQTGQCLYCTKALRREIEVDHFIPWSRHADDSLENLVAAHPTCNNQKRDFLAAPRHLASWVRRNIDHGESLRSLGRERGWHGTGRTAPVARAIYLRVPVGSPLWVAGGDFELADVGRITDALQLRPPAIAAETRA